MHLLQGVLGAARVPSSASSAEPEQYRDQFLDHSDQVSTLTAIVLWLCADVSSQNGN